VFADKVTFGQVLLGLLYYDIPIQRFSRQDKRGKLPKWIQELLDPHRQNLSVEEAIIAAKRWFPLMAQPLTKEDQLGVSLLSKEMINEQRDIMSKFGHVLHEFD